MVCASCCGRWWVETVTDSPLPGGAATLLYPPAMAGGRRGALHLPPPLPRRPGTTHRAALPAVAVLAPAPRRHEARLPPLAREGGGEGGDGTLTASVVRRRASPAAHPAYTRRRCVVFFSTMVRRMRGGGGIELGGHGTYCCHGGRGPHGGRTAGGATRCRHCGTYVDGLSCGLRR